MTKEEMSASNVKDGIQNPGFQGVSLVTAGSQLWCQRVERERMAMQAVKGQKPKARHPPLDMNNFQAAQQSLRSVRAEIHMRTSGQPLGHGYVHMFCFAFRSLCCV